MVVSGVVGTVSAAFSAVFYSAAALWLRWDLALATFVLAPLFLLAARRFSGRIKEASQDERVADGAITSVVEESLGNVVLTQAYNRRGDEEKRLDREARAWMKASVRGARLSEMYEQFVEVVETLCVLAVIGLGVWEISADRMTLGQLLAFAAFIGYLYPPVRNLGQLGLTLTAATAGAQRLNEILDAEPSVADPAEPVRAWPVRGWVGFHGVSFRYPHAARHSLNDVTFTASPRRTGDHHGPERRRQVHPVQAPHPLLRPLRGRDHPGRRPAHGLYPWSSCANRSPCCPRRR